MLLLFDPDLMQIGHGLRYLSHFFVGFGIGFASVWQLTLVTLAVVPLIAVAGGTYTFVMSSLSEKGEAAYAQAGKVAEEVNNVPLISIHQSSLSQLCLLVRRGLSDWYYQSSNSV